MSNISLALENEIKQALEPLLSQLRGEIVIIIKNGNIEIDPLAEVRR
jgi:hypothetical protein